MLCIGGIDMRAQMDMLKRGVHIVVATPGRLKDLLTKRRMNLDICRCAWRVCEGGGGRNQSGSVGCSTTWYARRWQLLCGFIARQAQRKHCCTC